MASHFSKFRGLKNNMRHTELGKSYIEKMIVREPKSKIEKLHPKAKMKLN